MAPPKLRLTQVEFKIETFVGEFDLSTGVQINARKLVAYATFEAGTTEKPQFHSVLHVRGIVGPHDGNAAALDAAWSNVHDLAGHWFAQTNGAAKVTTIPLPERKSA